jgi:hypothetical protein
MKYEFPFEIWQKDEVTIEFFICAERNQNRICHGCLVVDNLMTIVDQCRAEGYRVVEHKIGLSYFVLDRDGNRWELKSEKPQ